VMATLRWHAIDELHDAADQLDEAWHSLAVAVGRDLEGWDDPASRVTDARQRVRLVTGAANAALDRALAKAGL
jgi:hypothetical protein